MNTATISALQAKIWLKELFADVPTMLFFDKWMGEEANNPIQVVRDLTKQDGDSVEFGLATKLSGDGVEGDDELEGNEEEVNTYNDTLVINQLRHAVRVKGKMDERKVAYNTRKKAKELLKIWWAERTDKEVIYKLTGQTAKTFANTPDAPSTNRLIFAGGQSAANNLTAGHVFDTKCIVKAKQVAITASPKIRPITLSDQQHRGEAKYFIVVHPYQATDLRKDPVWNQAQRDANVRGSSNPVLSGALGEYDGCAIFQHESMYTFANNGAVPCARAVLLGQQAAIMGIGEDDRWVEKSFDYGNKWGIAAGRIWGVVKPRFNSEDYGVVAIDTAATVASTA